MKDKTACFTGHRIIPRDRKDYLLQELIETIESLYKKDYRYFCSGGAIGFDTLAALAVIELKKRMKIELIMVLPCENQAVKWKEKEIITYNTILKNADRIIYVGKDYYDGCMKDRNKKLVEMSSVCVSYLKRNFGGTYQTVSFAEKEGLEIINLL